MSAYSDTLYAYNLNNRLLKTIPIQSEFFSTKAPIPRLNDIVNNSININDNLLRNGFISQLLWDKYRNKFYCFVRGEMADKEFPYSIIVFDEDFKKLQEIKMDYKKYTLSSFVGPEGLYILNKDQNNQYVNRKYTIFQYEND